MSWDNFMTSNPFEDGFGQDWEIDGDDYGGINASSEQFSFFDTPTPCFDVPEPMHQRSNSDGQFFHVNPQINHRRTPSEPSKLLFNFSSEAIDSSKQNQQTTAFPMHSIPHPVHIRQSSLPSMSFQPLVDDEFQMLCNDKAVVFNPHELGFIPSKYWPNQTFTFGQLVTDFFQRKNSSNTRFSHKLFNALRISNYDSFYSDFLGVEWITDRVLRVDKNKFARLLGIKTIDGSFFHSQGNFPSHGFVELDQQTAQQLVPDHLEGVDYDNIRLFIHPAGIFYRGCTEKEIEQCKWISQQRRKPCY